MDHRVEILKTPEECEIFAKNATDRKRPDLALEARRKAVEMRVSTHETTTPAEADALAGVYAYEAMLTRKNGKKTRASATWQVVRRHGIIEAVQRALRQPAEPKTYETLVEMGLADLAFEAIVLRHTEAFSEDAIRVSQERMDEIAAA
jgi:hypothetical protein